MQMLGFVLFSSLQSILDRKGPLVSMYVQSTFARKCFCYKHVEISIENTSIVFPYKTLESASPGSTCITLNHF